MKEFEDHQAADVEFDRAKAQPVNFVPAFYRILGNAPSEFWQVYVDRQR